MSINDTLAKILLVACDQSYDAGLDKNDALGPYLESDARGRPPNTMPESFNALPASEYGQLNDWKVFERYDDTDTGFGATLYYRDRGEAVSRS